VILHVLNPTPFHGPDLVCTLPLWPPRAHVQAQELFSQAREALNSGDAANALALLSQAITKDGTSNR
jgi:hypothetical protein